MGVGLKVRRGKSITGATGARYKGEATTTGESRVVLLGPASGLTTTIEEIGAETVAGAGCREVNKDFQKALVLRDLLSNRD